MNSTGLALLALFCSLSPSFASEFVILRPSADTTLAESYPNNNSGAVEWFNIGSIQNPDGTPESYTYQVNGSVSYQLNNSDKAFAFGDFLTKQNIQVSMSTNSYRHGNCN